jgi:hypothetical protein
MFRMLAFAAISQLACNLGNTFVGRHLPRAAGVRVAAGGSVVMAKWIERPL